jgi:hypothetical protein
MIILTNEQMYKNLTLGEWLQVNAHIHWCYGYLDGLTSGREALPVVLKREKIQPVLEKLRQSIDLLGEL